MKVSMFIIPILLAGSSTSTWAGFNFGDCSGSGTFEQEIQHYNGNVDNAVTVGSIPKGLQGLRISLISDKDVDIRLYGANNEKIVHWPNGILNRPSTQTKPYKNVSVTYSGFNGTAGNRGHEFIEVTGSTPEAMTMKAFGYEAGYATVNYSWTGKDGCEPVQTGSGSFTQDILLNEKTLVGTIPPNIENVEITLQAATDIDIQLYGADGTPIIAWPSGLLSDSGFNHITYKGMDIEWSGYNGVNGNAGHEFIRIVGATSELLVMKVFGYAAGTAEVTYRWGNALTGKKYPATTTLVSRATDTNLPAPNAGEFVIDNVFGTKITKVNKTDNAISNYPKVQSWNQDMTLLRIGSRIYNATTLEETAITSGKTTSESYQTLCSRSSDYFRWSNVVPNRFFVMNSSYQFIQGEINGTSVDCSTVLNPLDAYEVVHIGPHEGNIDTNDKYVLFSAKKPNDSTIYLILFNIPNKTEIWTKPLPNEKWIWIQDQNYPNDPGKGYWIPEKMDWISVSPSGTYIVMNNTNGPRDGMYRYDRSFQNKTKLQYRWDGNGQLYSEGGHGDMGYDTNGNEVWVQFISGVGVYSFNLDNPVELGKELLTSPYGGGHISCRNTQRTDGWCYVTTTQAGYLQVFALKLDGSGNENVQNFSQTHVGEEYETVYGAPSPDGTKMIFNSYWGHENHANVDTFIVEVP